MDECITSEAIMLAMVVALLVLLVTIAAGKDWQ